METLVEGSETDFEKGYKKAWKKARDKIHELIRKRDELIVENKRLQEIISNMAFERDSYRFESERIDW